MSDGTAHNAGPWGYDGPLPDYLPNGAPRSKSSSELAREMRQAAFAENTCPSNDEDED